MSTTIKKWGNSLAVRLPKNIVERLHVREGSSVRLGAEEGRIFIEPISPRSSLKELTDDITPKNRHEATDWGEPIGKEIW